MPIPTTIVSTDLIDSMKYLTNLKIDHSNDSRLCNLFGFFSIGVEL